jgi:hypothetical protein
MFNYNRSGGKEAKKVVDQMKCSSSSKPISTDHLSLTLAYRFGKAIAGEHPQMVIPTGSVN